jgi:RNA polymerase sigma-70 factor (ECF subfamily)
VISRCGIADALLVERVVADRDPEALRELYVRHTPRLYAMARRMLGDSSDAEDAVHDTWIRAVEGFARFEWRSRLETWLAAILINCAREAGRAADREDQLDDDHLATDADHDFPWPVDAIDLERAIATLATGYRRVLVLHDIEGFTHEEIAGMLDIEAGTSKSQLARARRALKALLTTADGKEARDAR